MGILGGLGRRYKADKNSRHTLTMSGIYFISILGTMAMALIDKPGMYIPHIRSLPTSHLGVVAPWLILLARFMALLSDMRGGYEAGNKSRGTLTMSGMVHINHGYHGPD